jgi:formylglycine-generating enzyme required for sulfatase activity
MNIALQTITNLMLPIPKGEIVMRDDRTNNQWTVQIEPFMLTTYQVTQDLYSTVMKESPSMFKGNSLPVETVTWLEAITFCNLLSTEAHLSLCYSIDPISQEVTYDSNAKGFRLPTEAEWEYACKAGTNAIRYGNLDDIAWYKGNSNHTTQEVGLKQPNPWGLYDMLGNVWEWCSDVYDENVYGSYRIFRGGGWCDDERGCLATNRRRSHPTSFKIEDLGFRIAKNV